jgi:hypothetical protein
MKMTAFYDRAPCWDPRQLSSSCSPLWEPEIVHYSCPITCYGGARGEKREILYSFLTLALDEGEVVSVTPTTLYPRERTPVPIGYEAGWASEPVWTWGQIKKSFVPVRDWNLVIQSIVRLYTDWATPAPHKCCTKQNYIDRKYICKETIYCQLLIFFFILYNITHHLYQFSLNSLSAIFINTGVQLIQVLF